MQANADITSQHTALEGQKRGIQEADKWAKERLQQIQEAFVEQNSREIQMLGHGLTAAEAASWWTPFLAEFSKYPRQYEQILEQVNKYSQDAHKLLFSDVLKENPSAAIHLANSPEEHTQAIAAAARQYEELARMETEAQKGSDQLNKLLARQAEDLLHTGDRWDGYNSAVAASAEIQAENASALAAANDEIALARGDIDQQEFDTRAAARAAGEYTLKIQALREELTRLQAASKLAANPLGGAGINTDPANAAKIQQVQNEIAKLTGAQAVSKTTDQNKIVQDIAAPYLSAFNKIDTEWRKVQNDIIAGNKNIKADFVQMGVHLVQDAAAATEKMLADFVRKEILKVAAKHAADAAVTASAATSAATQGAIESTSPGKNTQQGGREGGREVLCVGLVMGWAYRWSHRGRRRLYRRREPRGARGLRTGRYRRRISRHAGSHRRACRRARSLSSTDSELRAHGQRLYRRRIQLARALHLSYAPTINAFDRHGFAPLSRRTRGISWISSSRRGIRGKIK